ELLSVQRGVLDQLLSDGVATRILEAPFKLKDAKNAFRLSELYDVLQEAIWKELKTGQEINLLRRNLQREHLRRLAATLIHSSDGAPADARALQRENARELLTTMKAASARPGLSKETKAHLADSANTLDEALKAPLRRAGI
ncbi:MAG: metallopeptidase, partial [Burkholderiales bacterium]|nr:metallopeptidase [Burkholderiales bacterium]